MVWLAQSVKTWQLQHITEKLASIRKNKPGHALLSYSHLSKLAVIDSGKKKCDSLHLREIKGFRNKYFINL